jgi:hypothetical protein
MDESSFDDLIKGKLENYEDPTIDPGAFESFQEKLVASQPIPWYDQNLSRLGMAASAVLITLLNIYILTRYNSTNEVTVLLKETKTKIEKIDSLNSVISRLSARQNVVSKNLNDKENLLAAAAKENETLKDNLIFAKDQLKKATKQTIDHEQSSLISLGKASEIPASLLRVLSQEELILVDDKSGQVLLFTSHRLNHVLRQSQFSLSLSPIQLLSTSEIAEPDFDKLKIQTPATLVKGTKKLMSLKQRNDLEKHYFSGIGINIGGHLDLLQSSFSSGNGSVNPRIGVLADWVVSPRLSVETGIDYFANSVSFEKNFQDIFLPRQTDQFGPLQTAQIDNKLLSSPVSLKYRQWVGEKTQSIVRIGYTPYYSFSSTYVYGYPPTKPDKPWDPDDAAYKKPRINTVEQSSIQGYYGGSITGSIGLSQLIKKKNVFEASVFYEKSLGTVGQQGLKMDQIGLRTAYLFKVK